MKLPATAKEARRLKLSHYFTGKPCAKGHIATKRTNNYTCTVCAELTRKNKVGYKHTNGPIEVSTGDIFWNGRLRKCGEIR